MGNICKCLEGVTAAPEVKQWKQHGAEKAQPKDTKTEKTQFEAVADIEGGEEKVEHADCIEALDDPLVVAGDQELESKTKEEDEEKERIKAEKEVCEAEEARQKELQEKVLRKMEERMKEVAAREKEEEEARRKKMQEKRHGEVEKARLLVESKTKTGLSKDETTMRDTIEWLLGLPKDLRSQMEGAENFTFSMLNRAPSLEPSVQTRSTWLATIQSGSVEAVELLLKRGYRPALLNFANGYTCGGSFDKKVGSQEEDIFLKTSVFLSLWPHRRRDDGPGVNARRAEWLGDYDEDFPRKESFYDHTECGGIYSPHVCIVRNTTSRDTSLLEASASTDLPSFGLITVAAQNVTKHPPFRPELLEEKVRTILWIAASKGHDSIVLGAFGCGYYKNPPNVVADTFSKLLCSGGEFENMFSVVAFGIVGEGGSAKPFLERFPVKPVPDRVHVDVEGAKRRAQTLEAEEQLRTSSLTPPLATCLYRAPTQSYSVGQAVLYFSETNKSWIPCNIVTVDSGGVEIDMKRGYKLQGVELQNKLKPKQGESAPVTTILLAPPVSTTLINPAELTSTTESVLPAMPQGSTFASFSVQPILGSLAKVSETSVPEQGLGYDVRLEVLSKNPDTLDKKLQDIFFALAKKEGEDKVLKIEDLHNVQQHLSEIVGTPPTLDELSDFFWRYIVSEAATLGEREAMVFLKGIILRCRDAACPTFQRKLHVPEKQSEDDYIWEKELGRGAFGEVWLATQKKTDRKVVLKSHDKGNHQMPVEEIDKEFQMMMTLKHPRIARYYEIFQDSTYVYIASEPYYGGDLSGLIGKASEANIDITECWLARLFKQVAQGMSFLHAKGIIHCDLKGENVMVANENDMDNPQVVVIDFGLAGSLNAQTHAGGTPGYMPPEVWTKGLWTPRGDVFSLGCLIFTMVMGENPFCVGARRMEDIKQLTLLSQPALDFGSFEFRDITSSLLLKDFKQRPPMDRFLLCPWILESGRDEEREKIGPVALEKLARKTRQSKLRKALLMDVASKENLAQLTELNQLFIQMDANNDGSLSAKEIRDALTKFNWSQQDIQKFLDCMLDCDADGAEVPYEEFMVNLLGITGHEEDELLARIFREADIDDKRTLNIRDIEELLKRDRIRQVLGSRDAARVLESMDRDGDGFVTLEEFKEVLNCGVSPKSRTRMRGQSHGTPGFASILRTYRPVKRIVDLGRRH